MDAGVVMEVTGGAVMPVLLDCAFPLTSRRPNDRVGVQSSTGTLDFIGTQILDPLLSTGMYHLVTKSTAEFSHAAATCRGDKPIL